MYITVKTNGEENLQREFRKLSAVTDDFSPVFKAVQKKFYEIEEDQFQSGGAGKTGKWQPLSESYLKQKVAKYGTFALLAGTEIASEKLYKALTGKSQDGAVTNITKNSAQFGTDLPYARAQHAGYAPRNLPARPLIDLTDAQIEDVGKTMKKVVTDDVRKTAFKVTESNFEDI